MKRIPLFLLGFIMLAMSCNKQEDDFNALKQEDLKVLDQAQQIIDSLAAIDIGYNEIDANENLKLKSAKTSADWSGKIHVTVYSVTSTMNQHNTGLTCTVNSDEVCVGGGAYPLYDDYGVYITETRPLSNLSGWVASSKDHGKSDPYKLVTQAIGLKIDGISKSTLLSHINLKQTTSSSSNRPRADLTATPDKIVIGGGAKILYNGSGILMVHNKGYNGWLATGKDHSYKDTGTITAYLIEMDKNIPGVGEIEMAQMSGSDSYVNSGYSLSEVTLPSNNSVITCIGGSAYYDCSYGRLLTEFRYISPLNAYLGSKDHSHKCNGFSGLYATRIKLKN